MRRCRSRYGRTEEERQEKAIVNVIIFVIVNVLAISLAWRREDRAINKDLAVHAAQTKEQFDGIMVEYRHSFQLFTEMLTREIENNPNPDDIWDYLKEMDSSLFEIEGKTFDGLYMYYQGRYLYSWDTLYSQYEETGYDATERPWYKDAIAGDGKIVFTPPYMSYANNYVLTTISQLQPDGETVFAYDIKMEDIQTLVAKQDFYDRQQVLVYDDNGTVIGSTKEEYLGGNLYQSQEEAGKSIAKIEDELDGLNRDSEEEAAKLQNTLKSAKAFLEFKDTFGDGTKRLEAKEGSAVPVRIDGTKYYGCMLGGDGFSFLILAPQSSVLKDTMATWLIPILVVELLLIYILAAFTRGQRNKELRQAYVELGQTQRRLEIALSMAQEAAAIDDLTGMMNAKSFRKDMMLALSDMDKDSCGILLMIDGDHFKRVNDNYGHTVGDDVIKLTAQMIIGRIRTVDLASRLHGDEFAIFIMDTCDFAVAKKIMEDINRSIAKEAGKRKMPAITLSAGAVIAKKGDSYAALAKEADSALYKAKETHNGGFAYNEKKVE